MHQVWCAPLWWLFTTAWFFIIKLFTILNKPSFKTRPCNKVKTVLNQSSLFLELCPKLAKTTKTTKCRRRIDSVTALKRCTGSRSGSIAWPDIQTEFETTRALSTCGRSCSNGKICWSRLAQPYNRPKIFWREESRIKISIRCTLILEGTNCLSHL